MPTESKARRLSLSGITALPAGTVLAGRFEIQSFMGRGGFSIAYLATDLAQQDECVVKELAPNGAVRNGIELDLSGVYSTNPSRLRKKFLEEANVIGKLESPGVLHLRDAFEENGTAYYVTDLVRGARTLDSILAQEGRFSSDKAKDIFLQLMDILEAVHAKGVIHRDIKPSNILISENGEVFLIDFGAAREWHADSAALQTVLFTPGYAPLEQLSDRGRRGPATDIYALCATAYHMVAGYSPRPSAERIGGTEMEPLSRIRPDLDVPLGKAVAAGLKLHFQDRPQTIEQLRAILLIPDPNEPDSTSLDAYDASALRLKRFTYNRFECPVCGSVLENPRPLRAGACPVYRTGTLRERHLPEHLCPSCRTGVLRHFGGRTPILFCPFCKRGKLDFHRKGFLLNRWMAECPSCGRQLEGDATEARDFRDRDSEPKPWSEWLQNSTRSNEAWICDLCEHQYEVLANGRLLDIQEKGLPGEQYYPDEWARIAAGLRPDSGNTYCDECDADYWQDEYSLTLLCTRVDPYKYSAKYLEQPIDSQSVSWLGAGKTSGNRGPLCPHCDTEFDEDGQFYRLVHTPSVRLSKYAEKSLVISDWHRLAQGLPISGEEEHFFGRMDEAIRQAFLKGDIAFDSRNERLLWSGHAREVMDDAHGYTEVGDGTLTVSLDDISFGRLLRRWRVPFASVLGFEAEGDLLRLSVSGEEKSKIFQLEPAELIVHLDSGDRPLWIDAELLAERMQVE